MAQATIHLRIAAATVIGSGGVSWLVLVVLAGIAGLWPRIVDEAILDGPAGLLVVAVAKRNDRQR